MKNIMVVLTGPTAVGKTHAALQLAAQIPAEIINADIGQCYTPLTIGTAKPDWRNQKVPHHLFDSIDEPKNITVVSFREQLLAVVAQVQRRKKLPIIVGGSAFYVKSIFFPPQPAEVSKSDYEKITQQNLWQQLQAVDPMRAAQIHPSDTYRLERALALWHATGKLPSLLTPTYHPPQSFYCTTFSRAKEQLYSAIDERVVQMINQGWVEEVAGLLGSDWEPFLKKKKIIGYDIIIEYLNAGKATTHRDEMIALIQTKTRQYAKRQIIFFKGFEKQLAHEIAQKHDEFTLDSAVVETVDLTLLPLDLYIEQLSQFLLSYYGTKQ